MNSGFIVQSEVGINSSHEVRSIVQYCDITGEQYNRVSFACDLSIYPNRIPVGSVEFVQKYAKENGITLPKFDPYPKLDKLKGWYRRNIIEIPKRHIPCYRWPMFIKPVGIKLFTGFTFYGYDYPYYDDFQKEQLEVLCDLPDDTLLYMSDVLPNIKAEWRCYVTDRNLVDICRYDDSEEEYPDPDPFYEDFDILINQIPHKTYALDIGLLGNNRYVVIECNDAWAIGRYPPFNMKEYAKFLTTRWNEICQEQKN